VDSTNPNLEPGIDDEQMVIDGLVNGRAVGNHGVLMSEKDWERVLQRGRELGITPRFIKECRLSGSQPAIRLCVSCDIRFASTGYHNRLCQRCRRS